MVFNVMIQGLESCCATCTISHFCADCMCGNMHAHAHTFFVMKVELLWSTSVRLCTCVIRPRYQNEPSVSYSNNYQAVGKVYYLRGVCLR